jgi:hypothetical protein
MARLKGIERDKTTLFKNTLIASVVVNPILFNIFSAFVFISSLTFICSNIPIHNYIPTSFI